MSQAIVVQDVTKTYRIGAKAKGDYATLRDTISQMAMAPFRRFRSIIAGGTTSASHEQFDALKDVSFSVAEGEVLGVIGRNGAGKSTLLKILSRITEPTSGRIEMRGRVASLLEVGTGFHPELTGRENIFLNGAILGMKHREVQQKFDEIVEFSGVEKFLETPVKRYSSGMRVRLGFAVAAHLEFEILIVDEVLAVGDAAFQKKCMGRMTDVASTGRTVLFVSHNLGVLQRLCPRAIWLREGRLVTDGKTAEVVASYLEELSEAAEIPLCERTDRRGDGKARVTSVQIECESGSIQVGQPAKIRLRMSPSIPTADALIAFYDKHGVLVAACDSRVAGSEDRNSSNGDDSIDCFLEDVPFTPGRYRANVAIYSKGQLCDHIEGAFILDVNEGVHGGRSVSKSFPGVSVVRHRWVLPNKDQA